MVGLKLLAQAKASGLSVRSERDRLVVRGPRSVRALAEALLADKEAVLAVLRQDAKPTSDPFTETFQKAVTDLSRRYRPGTLGWVVKHHPDLDRQIDEAQARLDAVWRNGMAGKAHLEEFREALKVWWKLYGEAIRLHQHGQEPDRQ